MNEKRGDFFLSCKECVLENPRNFYGSFSLGPFKNSQSLTVANALRRTLLSEIHGIAITHVEIEGATHEYTTLVGVRESILDILLNFKHIVLKTMSPFKKPVYGYLNVRGPGIIRASDLKLPPTIQIVDPDQYIATLNENGKLFLKLTISDFKNSQKNEENFEGFLNIPKSKSSENFMRKKFTNRKIGNKAESFQNFENKKRILFEELYSKNKSIVDEKKFNNLNSEETKISVASNNKNKNTLWVDPLFNPILKVNYAIETVEPVQKNVPNQILFIELWTNGSIHPRKAFYQTLLYLKTMFDKLDSMRFLNYQFTNYVLDSQETKNKFLKSFEYDYGFYNLVEEKKNSSVSTEIFLPVEIQQVENDYVVDLINASNDPWENISLEKLNLPYRVQKILEKNNCFVVGDLLKLTPKELKTFPGIGSFCFSTIIKSLKKYGLKFKNEK
uniref:DNA-directed RNA polymerase n=1 Tax=Pectinodesmus pectinatus TaxID=91197 RepID=A0A2H4FBZ0_9CHLO|nr:RNA polymerase alpha subunit [Pectinodesmus pectinatus]AOS53103.1 RNA polymerase alpha subunit [Pectinodesmus pectinatus]